MSDRPTFVFFPEGAYGPTNNCVGIGQVLRARGARVVFVVEESFAGTLEAQGFEEALMRLKPPPVEPEVPGQFWKDFVRETAPEFRKPTIDQLEGFVLPVWQELVDGARYVDERLAEVQRLCDRVVAAVRDHHVDLRQDRRLRQKLLAGHVRR